MAGKSINLKLGHLTIKGVFRHKWDNPEDLYNKHHAYKNHMLGLWFRRDWCIGTKRSGKSLFAKDNHFPSYKLGLHLIYANAWLEISWRVRTFNTKKDDI